MSSRRFDQGPRVRQSRGYHQPPTPPPTGPSPRLTLRDLVSGEIKGSLEAAAFDHVPVSDPLFRTFACGAVIALAQRLAA